MREEGVGRDCNLCTLVLLNVGKPAWLMKQTGMVDETDGHRCEFYPFM